MYFLINSPNLIKILCLRKTENLTFRSLIPIYRLLDLYIYVYIWRKIIFWAFYGLHIQFKEHC